MTSPTYYDESTETVRYSFDIPKPLHDKMRYYLPYGTKKYFLVRLIELAVEGMETGGPVVVGAILQGDYTPLADAIKKREQERSKEE